MASCNVRQEGDELACACGLRWSVQEPSPVACSKNKRRNVAREVARTILSPPPVPVTVGASVPVRLSTAVARDMAWAYENKRHLGGSYDVAMQAAYEVFLRELP